MERKHIQFIRQSWKNASAQNPFLFTKVIPGTEKTFEQFCTEYIITRKYYKTSRKKQISED